MTVTKRLRYEILRRDNHTCRYCGATAPDAKLTVDHVLPVALGGSDASANLVAACSDCNAGKSSSNPSQPLIEQVSSDDLRWADAVKRAAAEAAALIEDRAQYVEAVDKMWKVWTWGPDNDRFLPRPSDWRRSIGTFYERRLPIRVLTEALIKACTNDRISVDDCWRYFMGVAWRKLDEITEAAKAMYDAEGLETNAS